MAVALATYATRIKTGDEPLWFTNWAIAHRQHIALVVLACALVQILNDAWRWYTGARHPAKETLQKLVEDFSKTHFKERTKKNRVTLFRATQGWRVFFYGVAKLSLRKQAHKWHALWSVKWNETYLGVYVRPASVRNSKSASALKVSDHPSECEGVAGLIWEEGGTVELLHLPAVDIARLRSTHKIESLPDDDPLRVYCNQTNIRSIDLARSFDHFGRHFLGTVIRRSDGTQWGVLLIDSEDSECTFASEDSDLKMRLDDFARVVGKIVA
jgi:hypothetical protein